VRYRAKLVMLRSGLKAQVHAVLAKEGVAVPMSDLFGLAGNALMSNARLAHAYGVRMESLRDLIEAIDEQVRMLEGEVGRFLGGEKGYEVIQQIPGVGPVLAAVFVAEIGDVTLFSSPDKLASWAGLTSRHRESDTEVVRGHITKQGRRLVRWAAVEAAKRQTSFPAERYERISALRGSARIARVALARHVLTLVYYGLRDGEIRCLAEQAGQGPANGRTRCPLRVMSPTRRGRPVLIRPVRGMTPRSALGLRWQPREISVALLAFLGPTAGRSHCPELLLGVPCSETHRWFSDHAPVGTVRCRRLGHCLPRAPSHGQGRCSRRARGTRESASRPPVGDHRHARPSFSPRPR
jgi:hypothetical protein